MSEKPPPPEQMAARALDAYKKGALPEAIAGFRSAQRAYQDVGDEARADEMANSLCVALLQAGEPQQALEAVRHSPERFLARGDLSHGAQAYGNLAAAQ